MDDGPLMIELRRSAIVEKGSFASLSCSLLFEAVLEARDIRRRLSAREDDGEP